MVKRDTAVTMCKLPLIAFSVALLLTVVASAELSCSRNEVYSNCSNVICRAQKCEQRGIPVACPAVSSCDTGCVCDVGFLRNSTGTCVEEDKCDIGPTCPENEVFSICANALCRHQECYKRGQPVYCAMLLKGGCRRGCVCDVGYLRNLNGTCIKEEECEIGPTCPENEVFSMCGNALCRHQECYKRDQPVYCPMKHTGSCRRGCVCDVGYLRNSNGTCIKEGECENN